MSLPHLIGLAALIGTVSGFVTSSVLRNHGIQVRAFEPTFHTLGFGVQMCIFSLSWATEFYSKYVVALAYAVLGMYIGMILYESLT
jgi:hypothetical protein